MKAGTARAETVGSLLRPDFLKQARQERLDGRISQEQLQLTEDRAVNEAIELQQQAGLDVITDGEMRRVSWITTIPIVADRLHEAPLAGFTYRVPDQPSWFAFWRNDAGQIVPRSGLPRAFMTERLTVRPEHSLLEREYAFLKANARTRTKYSFPAPSYHRVFWHPEYSRDAYPRADDFLREVRDYVREHLVKPLIEMGCDYIQLDAPNYGQFYVDADVRQVLEQEGHELQAELIADAEIDSSVFEGIDGITRALHVCRGNGPGGTWSAAGGYEPIARDGFPRMKNIDTLLLEYDTERAGDFSPLRHVLPDTTVVLGLLTTKRGTLESAESLEHRVREATQLLPMERLAISPQCGFNSAGEGNRLSVAEQEAKLRLVGRLARQLWAD
jgi:5-methyltetrahydropteroyltriglutamate--homocysteine methyltransferase